MMLSLFCTVQNGQWYARADSRFVSSQWEMVLLCNDISHWLGASLKSAQLALDHLLPRSTLTILKDYQQSHCTVWWTGILYVPDHRLPQYWHQKIIGNHSTLCDARGSCMYQTICCLNIDIKRLSTVTLHCVMYGDLVCTRPSAASTLTTSKNYQQSRCTVRCTGILYVPDHLLPQHWWHQKIINSHTTLCDGRGFCMYQTICCLNIDNIKILSAITLHCVMYGDLVCTRPSAASTLTSSKDYQQSQYAVWCTGILYVSDHLLPNTDDKNILGHL